MSQDDSLAVSVEINSRQFVVRREGLDLRVGEKLATGTVWQDETVPIDALPTAARTALEAADTESADLNLALRSVATAFAERGG
jgi:hypothetical protein